MIQRTAKNCRTAIRTVRTAWCICVIQEQGWPLVTLSLPHPRTTHHAVRQKSQVRQSGLSLAAATAARTFFGGGWGLRAKNCQLRNTLRVLARKEIELGWGNPAVFTRHVKSNECNFNIKHSKLEWHRRTVILFSNWIKYCVVHINPTNNMLCNKIKQFSGWPDQQCSFFQN